MAGIDLLDDLFDLPDDTSPMNAALSEWAAAHKGDEPSEVAARRPVHGPCSMCRNAATTRCLRCERPVCIRHHHVMVGICDRCMDEAPDEEPPETDKDPYADERPPTRPELDLDWIE